jgi:pimeloyl-ACP methyl ester carboxylesterase
MRLVKGYGGVDIAVHHLGGDGPPVMMAHATGFHGRCWQPLAASLTPEFSVWAIDFRGHGASGKDPAGRYDDWDVFVEDLLAVIDDLGPDGWGGVGHSLGGGVLLMAEARRPGTFSALCLYEPIVVPPDTAEAAQNLPPPVSLAELARKRRPAFPSKRAAFENYASKPPFNRFDPAALEAYVEYGLVEQPDGTVRLACNREDEASVFEGAPGSRTWELVPAVHVPVAVLAGSDPLDPVAHMSERVARRLRRAGLVRFPHLDHFGPFVAPAEVGAVVAEGLRVAGGAAVHHDRPTL